MICPTCNGHGALEQHDNNGYPFLKETCPHCFGNLYTFKKRVEPDEPRKSKQAIENAISAVLKMERRKYANRKRHSTKSNFRSGK